MLACDSVDAFCASRTSRRRAETSVRAAPVVLSATWRPSTVCRARYTSPMPPAATKATSSYGPRRSPGVRRGGDAGCTGVPDAPGAAVARTAAAGVSQKLVAALSLASRDSTSRCRSRSPAQAPATKSLRSASDRSTASRNTALMRSHRCCCSLESDMNCWRVDPPGAREPRAGDIATPSIWLGSGPSKPLAALPSPVGPVFGPVWRAFPRSEIGGRLGLHLPSIQDPLMKRLARLIRVVAGAAAIAGCASQPSTSPITPSTSAILMRSNSDASPAPAAKAARSGTLHVVKECHEYQGGAGQFCTVTASNVKEIEPGSTVTYLSAAVDGLLDSDLILKLPGPGDNR